MDYAELVESHTERGADITIAAQPVTTADATEMGIFRFDRAGSDRRVRGEADARAAGRNGQLAAARRRLSQHAARQAASWPRWASTCSRARCCSTCSSRTASTSARRSSLRRSGRYHVNAFLHRGYWADVGTIGAYYDANLMLTQGRTRPSDFTIRSGRSSPARARCRRRACRSARCATPCSPKAARSRTARSSNR